MYTGVSVNKELVAREDSEGAKVMGAISMAILMVAMTGTC